jgi:hypothetical protein
VLFLGANIDAISTGASLGVSADYAMNIGNSGGSSVAAFTAMSSAASRAVRGGRHHGSFTPSERHTSAPQQRGRGGRGGPSAPLARNPQQGFGGAGGAGGAGGGGFLGAASFGN